MAAGLGGGRWTGRWPLDWEEELGKSSYEEGGGEREEEAILQRSVVQLALFGLLWMRIRSHESSHMSIISPISLSGDNNNDNGILMLV